MKKKKKKNTRNDFIVSGIESKLLESRRLDIDDGIFEGLRFCALMPDVYCLMYLLIMLRSCSLYLGL